MQWLPWDAQALRTVSGWKIPSRGLTFPEQCSSRFLWVMHNFSDPVLCTALPYRVKPDLIKGPAHSNLFYQIRIRNSHPRF
ncbi:hypothetical protein V6N12_040498 [Hibiscus sabdariffa]|uniref:Uncharacterized protein n=1 Tax=Hibiscus sabdariffa TaxID=183260 RepID=A0ABR2E3X0_9ROSI